MNNPPCRVGHLFFLEINLSRSRKLLFGGNSRKGYSIILQMISGFNHLAYHETIIGSMQDWTCRYCKVEGTQESSEHLVSECDAFAYKRFRILGHPFPPKPYGWLSPGKLLDFLREVPIQWLPEDETPS